MPEPFDAVIIGSGVGGLTAARALSEFGRKRVLVLERHTTLGGLTHEFRRLDKYTFSTGVHYIGSGAEMASAPALFDWLTKGRLQWKRMPDIFDVIAFPDWSFGIPSSEAAYRKLLINRFPTERGAIDRYFPDMRRATRGLGLACFAKTLPAPLREISLRVLRLLYPSAFMWTRAYFDRRFREPALKALLTAQWGDYGPPPSQTALGFHALIVVHFLSGAAYPIGGSGRIAEAAVDAIREANGEALAGKEVREILLERGQVCGVRYADVHSGMEEIIRCPIVVSDAGVKNTYGALLPGAPFTDLRAKAEQLPDNPSAVVLFAGLKASPAELGMDGANHWLYPSGDHDAVMEAPPGDGLIFLSFPSLQNPSATAHVMEIVSFVSPRSFHKWSKEAWPRQAPEYLLLKNAIAAKLIARADAYRPGLKALIEFSELATPLTFTTFDGCHEGSFYGVRCSPDRLTSPLAGARTPVKGLYLSGQDAVTPGVLGAFMGGVVASHAALDWRDRGALWRRLSSAMRGVRHPAKRSNGGPWRGYLEVAEILRETPTVKTFRLRNPEGGALPFGFAAGQFLTIELPTDKGTVRRHYSISSAPSETDSCAITVKREAEGVGSRYLHNNVAPGRCFYVEGPLGRFTFSADEAPALVLIGGGVGIAPLMSVLRELCARGAAIPVTVLTAFRTRDEIIFGDELRELGSKPNIQFNCTIEHPDQGSGGLWHGLRGRLTLDMIASAQGLKGARVHVCGPAAMMDAVLHHLADLGVKADAIRTEAFSTGFPGEDSARVRAGRVLGSTVRRLQITMRKSGWSFQAEPGQSILAAAQASHVPMRYACGSGVCGECRLKIEGGTAETDDRGVLTPAERRAGFVLACQTYPTSDLMIEA